MGLQGMRKRLLLPCISSRWTKTAVMMSAGLVRLNESQSSHKFSISYCTPTGHTAPQPLCLPTSEGLAWRGLHSRWRSFSYASVPLADRGSGVGVRLITRPVFCIIVGFMICMERCDVYSSFLLCVILRSWISCAHVCRARLILRSLSAISCSYSYPFPIPSSSQVHFSFGCYTGQLIRRLYICSCLLQTRIDIR